MCGTSSASTVSAKMSGLGESRHTNTATASRDVRFAPKADKRVDVSLSPLSATNGLPHRSKRMCMHWTVMSAGLTCRTVVLFA